MLRDRMKPYLRLILGVIACLVLAGGAFVWATGIIDSLFAYRSPLREYPPSPGPPLGEPITRRVVFVLVDALRQDTASKADVMPFLDQLRQQGASATMHSRPPSYSQPAYSVLFTGAWPDLSDGPALNLEYEEIPTWTQHDLVSAAHRAGLETAVSAHRWFQRLIPQASVSTAFYTSGDDRVADREVVDAVLPWLREGNHQFVFVHLDQVDYAGHYEGGPLDPRWDAAARRVDGLLREIAATLDLDQDTLSVCSNHGQIDQGGHGGRDPIVLTEPFVLVGAGVRPGQYPDVRMVDVAPTLAAMLGANIPASSQGQVLADMLELSPDQRATVEDASEAQQRQLVDLYQAAIGRRVEVEPGGNSVDAHQSALEAARDARLNAERLPRAIGSLGIILLAAVAMFRKRGRELAWLAGSAVLFVALFHLRYAILDRRTYSFSSLVSAEDLILYCATTTLGALAVSWLVSSLGLKAFHREPRQAGEIVLGLTLITVCLLALPVLWSYTLNGALVSWTLPEPGSLFLALMALVEVLFVTGFGLLLAGLTALITKLGVVKGNQS